MAWKGEVGTNVQSKSDTALIPFSTGSAASAGSSKTTEGTQYYDDEYFDSDDSENEGEKSKSVRSQEQSYSYCSNGMGSMGGGTHEQEF